MKATTGQICVECSGLMVKAYVELDDGTWMPCWLCDCKLPEDTSHLKAFNILEADE